jgi:hypothetical protein
MLYDSREGQGCEQCPKAILNSKRKLFMHPHLSKSYEVEMTGKFQPKGSIYEVSFDYHSKMGGYTTLMSDIPKLYERRCHKKTI